VPKYVRISRVLRDIPPKFIVGGLKDSLRDVVRQRMSQQAIECKCIRCREYGHRARDGWEIGEPQMTGMDYTASGGKGIFLCFEDEDETLFGLLRMRIQSRPVALAGQGAGGFSPYPGTAYIWSGGSSQPAKPDCRAAQGAGRALVRKAERVATEEFQVRH